MPKFETYACTAPASWKVYLFNGDASALEDGEIAEADAFQKRMNELGYEWPVDCSEPEFMHRSDYGPRLAGDMCTYTFLKAK
jgi:hypothetical protein